MKRGRSGFTNPTADAIWNAHVGNNAFVRHRDVCPVCLEVYESCVQTPRWCSEGDRIFEQMLDEVHAQIDDVMTRQN